MTNEKNDKLKIVQELLSSAKNSIHSAEQLLRNMTGASINATFSAKEKANDLSSSNDGKIIEGVFDGEKMIGPDQKEYTVPENYASKSKLVEGDVLKLTISDDGGFMFKQINPVARKKAVGSLVKEGVNYKVVAEGKSYKILQAPVSFYKAIEGDQVTIIVPVEKESEWAALENVINKGEDQGSGIVLDEKKDDSLKKEESTVELPKEPEPATEVIESKEDEQIASNENKKEAPKEPEVPGEGVKELEI